MSSSVPSTAPETSEIPAVPAAEAPAVTDAPVASAAPAAPEMTPAVCAQQLKERLPALFDGAPKPLKLRIQADIKERAPGLFTKAVLSAFLRRYTGSTAYLIALTKAEQRCDLDGQPAGEITQEHRDAAQQELDRRRALHQERRAQEAQAERARRDQARAQERQAHAQQREAQALQEQQRRNRAQLLRDFESTTLTRGNFCTLKGVPEAELDALLERARKEKAEWLAQRPEQGTGGERGHGAGHREGREGRDNREGQDRPRGGRPGGRPGGAGGPRREGAPRREGGHPPRRDHDDRPRRDNGGENRKPR